MNSKNRKKHVLPESQLTSRTQFDLSDFVWDDLNNWQTNCGQRQLRPHLYYNLKDQLRSQLKWELLSQLQEDFYEE